MPFFSVIMPVYNRSGLLQDTVYSVLGQSFPDFELILVDDGSTDDTAAVIKALTDDRIQYIWQQNAERGAARNNGARNASGRYLIFFDSDDLMYPEHLAVAHEFINARKFPEVFYSPFEIKNSAGQVQATIWQDGTNLKNKLAIDNFLACNSVVIRKDIFDSLRFNEDRRLATAEDKELWLRVAARHRMLFNPHITFAMLEHEARSLRQLSGKRMEERTELLVSSLQADGTFMRSFGKLAKFIFAFEYCLVALVYAATDRSKARHFWLKALRTDPGVLRTRRFWATLKNIIIRK